VLVDGRKVFDLMLLLQKLFQDVAVFFCAKYLVVNLNLQNHASLVTQRMQCVESTLDYRMMLQGPNDYYDKIVVDGCVCCKHSDHAHADVDVDIAHEFVQEFAMTVVTDCEKI
jgi:hypothetical protein